MAEDYGAPEAGKLSRAWTRDRRETNRVAKERAAQRVSNLTMQNKMRAILGRMSAGAAGRFLDSPIERYEFNRKLGSLERRRERTQRA